LSCAGVAMADGTAMSVEEALRGLASEDEAKIEQGAAHLLESKESEKALPALEAICDERMLVAPDGSLYYKDEKGPVRVAATGAVASPEPTSTKVVDMNNALRRTVQPLIARLRLVSPDPDVRLAAANEL